MPGARSKARQTTYPYRNAGSGSRTPHEAEKLEESSRQSPLPAPSARGSSRHAGAAAALAPPIDADKQKQPHHVDKMPVPRRRLEPEMVVGFEMPSPCPVETD